MKKYLKYSLLLITLVSFYSCSNDDSKQEEIIEPVKDPLITIKLASEFAVQKYNVVEIAPEVKIENAEEKNAVYKWSTKVTGKDGVVKDSIVGDRKVLPFINATTADFTLNLTVTVGKIEKQASTKVTVSETGKTYLAKALTLVDYLPSPASNFDSYAFTSKTEVLTKIQTDLKSGNAIFLGSFGGSIVTAFDHTVVNAYGKRDFTVVMNNNTKYSPVSVYVAYDANKNGIADENEWYEIAGSEYQKSTTVKNYEMTYYKPDAAKTAVAGQFEWQFDTQYLKWTDNKNATGNITKTYKNRRRNYYPQWLGDSYTVKGTKIALPTKDISDGTGITFNVGTYEWGYGGIKDSTIDISWAVDKDGNKVHLPGIDFVKVYVPTFVEIGESDLLISSFKEVSDLNFPAAK